MDVIRPGHPDRFLTTVEVVPPAGHQTEPLLTALQSLQKLPIDGFSVATNPVAKPRMSAMALCALLQQQARPKILSLKALPTPGRCSTWPASALPVRA